MSSETESTGSGDAHNAKRSIQDLATGDLNVVGLIALAGLFAAFLCAVVFLGSMAYTLAHYRSWDWLVSIVVALIFAALALLSCVPLLIAQNEALSTVVGRVVVWGTCLSLAGLQVTAAVLGDASFAMSGVIGVTTVIGVACFGELAGYGIAES